VDDLKRGQRYGDPTKRAVAHGEDSGGQQRTKHASVRGDVARRYHGRETRAITGETALPCRGNVTKQH